MRLIFQIYLLQQRNTIIKIIWYELFILHIFEATLFCFVNENEFNFLDACNS